MHNELYPWLNSIYIQLIDAYKNNLMHHGILLYSNSGNGLERLCDSIIKWLICQNKKGYKNCKKCHSCYLMNSGNHPDLHILKLENKKINISVDSIRNLIEKINYYPQQDVQKIIYIPNTEFLSDAAANALLKTLEEPVKDTYFILKCEKQKNILSTIRSRCINYFIPTPNQDIVLSWLKLQSINLDKKNIITAIKLSNGSPITALELLKPDNWLEREKLCNELKFSIQQHNMLNLIHILNTECVLKQIKWLLSLLIDSIKLKQQTFNLFINYDQIDLVKILTKLMKMSQLIISYKQWQNCYNQLLTINGLSKELILINQLLRWETLINTL
ncbi:DNA polymerase III subunit delta' [Candidatus Providencia siddallii]|uniref:DNA polymerase III subunit delta' n=1 Tax=Candidatus Providencia siddallii TaxID=1715285 RepID=A0A0M6W7Z0_9GAMM|nr:DNA polymerase III subunit delta' [Candidatus Providencia siddallii]